MLKNNFHPTHFGIKKLLPLGLLISMLLLTACSSAGAPPVAATSAAGNNNVTKNLGKVGATLAPQGSSRDCQAMGDAFMDFVGEYPFMAIASDGAYTAANTPGSMTYIDIPRLRSDMALLATLPDSPTFGKLSPAIAQINQFIDNIETNFKSGKKPFSDGNTDGKIFMDLYAKLAQPYVIIADAFSTNCPNYSAPTSTPFTGTVSPQPGGVDDSTIATMTAAGASLEATMNAFSTAYPEPMGTPTP